MDTYITALCNEIEAYATKYPKATIDSIYIGGGTPSILSNEQLSIIFDALKKNFNLSDEWFSNHEVSIECNPTSVDSAKLKHWKQLGINRVSMGVQSLCDQTLKTLGRCHTSQDAKMAILEVSRYFDNISIDLIYGVPLTLEQVATDYYRAVEEELIDLMVGFADEIKHVSAYALTVEPGTQIHTKLIAGELIDLDEEEFFEQEDNIQIAMRAWGLKRYEVSNFAKPGYECKHNQRYWDPRKEYLGLGLAAHGLVDKVRYENTPDLDMYLLNPNKIAKSDKQKDQDLADEMIMLGLRTPKGIDLPALMKLGIDFRIKKAREIFELESAKLIRVNKKNIRATQEGMCVLNSVTSRLLLGS